jgi:hypothetical protein
MTNNNRGPESPGEIHFERYLQERGLHAAYEPDIGGRNPDFLVSHPVATFAAEVYEPVMEEMSSRSGFLPSPYEKYRGAFQARKRKQIAAVKGAGYCYVAVLASTHTTTTINPAFMAGAMFGELQWSWPIDPQGDGDLRNGRMTFGSGAALQPALMRGVSAVGLIDIFNPTQHVLDEAIAEVTEPRNEDWQRRVATLTDEEFEQHCATAFEEADKVARRLVKSGEYDPTAETIRIIGLHNPYAQFPLPKQCLSGPYDEQWGIVSRDGRSAYGPLAYGPLIGEVPGALAAERFETPFAAQSAVPIETSSVDP